MFIKLIFSALIVFIYFIILIGIDFLLLHITVNTEIREDFIHTTVMVLAVVIAVVFFVTPFVTPKTIVSTTQHNLYEIEPNKYVLANSDTTGQYVYSYFLDTDTTSPETTQNIIYSDKVTTPYIEEVDKIIENKFLYFIYNNPLGDMTKIKELNIVCNTDNIIYNTNFKQEKDLN